MTALQNWLTPEVTRAAALALLHFLWQGAALAALASATLAVFRNAATRYALAVAFLAAMIAAPLLTFAILKRQPEAAAPGVTLFRSATAQESTQLSFAAVAPTRAQNPSPARSLSWLPLLVEAWFLGVVLLSLRPAAGFVLVERLRRRQAKPIAAELRVRCLALERRLGITRVIQYFESRDLETPAAVGWFRPVIFLPLSAITGLSPGQLDAVITHELAHIKRLDSFVNLFQIAAETLLFYHPAVWWLSKRIRAERENCCDDVALSVCADPAAYARALASMAEWQVAPALAMAANRSPLAARVARILGAAKLEAGIRGASLAASALCLTASLVAGQALFGSHHEANAPQASAVTNSVASANPRPSASARTVPPAPSPGGDDPTIVVTAPSPAPTQASGHVPPPPESPAEAAEQENSPQPKSPEPKNNKDAAAPQSSYIEALKSAGLDHLSVDDLVAMKIQGVTADYVRELHALDLHPDVDDIIAMKIQGITPAFLKELSEQGLKSDVSDAIALKIQGVTPEYVRELRATFPGISSDDLLAMKVQGVKPEYVREMREVTAAKLNADEIIAMKVQGVSPEYVRNLKSLNLKLDADDVIAMKVQGVTADYVKSLQAAGLHFDAEELIGAKVQGITPEFIERARKMGFQNLDLDKLMRLKISGVLEP
jgi:beta-lactamase regulating signal transducer with metallopeptidase domain